MAARKGYDSARNRATILQEIAISCRIVRNFCRFWFAAIFYHPPRAPGRPTLHRGYSLCGRPPFDPTLNLPCVGHQAQSLVIALRSRAKKGPPTSGDAATKSQDGRTEGAGKRQGSLKLSQPAEARNSDGLTRVDHPPAKHTRQDEHATCPLEAWRARKGCVGHAALLGGKCRVW